MSEPNNIIVLSVVVMIHCCLVTEQKTSDEEMNALLYEMDPDDPAQGPMYVVSDYFFFPRLCCVWLVTLLRC